MIKCSKFVCYFILSEKNFSHFHHLVVGQKTDHCVKMGGDYLLISHQFGITPVVQYKVLWFQVSVDDTFGMQISKGLHHTSCVKSGG